MIKEGGFLCGGATGLASEALTHFFRFLTASDFAVGFFLISVDTGGKH